MLLGNGARLGPYEILGPLGHGGMGEVYRARHLKLRRDVAIKVLPAEFAGDASRLSRFEREARSASALNHPNIVTIHDIAEDHGTTYIAMELVEGRTLRDRIAEGPIPVGQALRWAEQLADGLAEAHGAGIVHRDIKPANVMVKPDGLVKILDFGLARPQRMAGKPESSGASLTTATTEGEILGTPSYMSPEQCAGDVLDHRSDQFALGIVLYEMLSGRRPFDGPSARAIVSAILVASPPPLRRLRPDVPAELERIIDRCLEKDPADRFASTAELATALHRHASRDTRGWRSLRSALVRPVVAVPVVATLGALCLAGWVWHRGAGKRWAGDAAIDEIQALTEKGDLFDAYVTAVRAETYRPGDPALQREMDRFTLPVPVSTDPPGADVEVRSYGSDDAPWVHVGVTPVTLRIPYALMHWRISRAGYEPFDGAPFGGGTLGELGHLRLDSAGTVPTGMVHVRGGPLALPAGLSVPGGAQTTQVGDFDLDRYEVTNREYREFVEAGGHETGTWWPPATDGDGTSIPLDEVRRAFIDATGQPGPATWEAGTYTEGRADYPVGGISWYEAAAYCAFAGKSLPTIYHWMKAIGQDQMSDILRYSNFESGNKAPIGRFRGLGAYGTYDMAGNVREWAWNASGSQRYILGGAWNEPGYMFRHLVPQDPARREATDGVRCAKYIDTPPAPLMAPVTQDIRYPRPPSLSEQEFALIRQPYAYDPTDLDARRVRVDSLADYRREVVSVRTPYGSGRMDINLLVPRDVAPPYQSVIWVPGGDVFAWRSSETLATSYLFDFIPRSGRVLVYPIYAGTYERLVPPPPAPNSARGREQIIRWEQDLSRTIDYLTTTRSDFDAGRIAYYGLSSGAWLGAIYTAVEPRFRASVLLGGGLIPQTLPADVNPAVFAPRSHVPTLMINGQDDFIMPWEESQKPLFDLLGVPGDRKRLERLPGGHMPADRQKIIREVLGWLDRWLGPVRRTRSSSPASGGS